MNVIKQPQMMYFLLGILIGSVGGHAVLTGSTACRTLSCGL